MPESEIVFVDGTNGATGSCTKSAPCKTIQQGVNAVLGPRKWVKIAPTAYAESVTTSGKTMVLLATGADLQPGGLNQPCLLVSGAATPTSLIVDGLRLHGGGGSDNADGLQCAIGAATAAPVIVLRKLTIDGNAGQGIDTSTCDITVERSTIRGNGGGGVSVSKGDFVITNNVIVKNGSGTSIIGGVLISGNPPSTAIFEFNTLTANVAASMVPSGLQCVLGTTPLVFRNSIVFGNTVSGGAGQVAGTNCSWTYSDIGPEAVSGTGDINMAPSFVNAAANDYHLIPGSAGINAADPAATVTVDIDGNTRPAGGRADMGADEVP